MNKNFLFLKKINLNNKLIIIIKKKYFISSKGSKINFKMQMNELFDLIIILIRIKHLKNKS